MLPGRGSQRVVLDVFQREISMKKLFFATVLGIGLLATTGVYAADAPAGATAQCKDGTYYSGASHKGACKGHQGVQTWLDKKDAAASSSKAASAKSTSAKSSSKATAASSTKTSTAKSTAATNDAGSGTPIAKCKDGTTFNGTSHRGACRGHKGVDTWLDEPAAGGAAASPKTSTTSTSAKAPPPAAPASAPSMAPSSTPSAAKTASPPTPSSEIKAQAGGGAGKVWVNSGTKVYHCQDDQWYGKTKEGSYMTEAQAKAAGNRASRGKDCGN
jgi:hypothetical protein